MKKHQDLRRKKIGFWQVGEAFKKENGKIYYHCTCVCGKERDVYGSLLSIGKSSILWMYGETYRRRPCGTEFWDASCGRKGYD